MNKISFFTPLSFQAGLVSKRSKHLERIDNYFFLKGKRACVINPSQAELEVVLTNSKSHFLLRVVKVISYLTVFIPLAMLVTKAALRSKYKTKIIDPQQKLEEGVQISATTINKIQSLFNKIQKKEDDDELEWLGKGNNLVFKIKDTPDLVFKMTPNGFGYEMNARFSNMVKAKTECMVHNLFRLHVPNAKKFEIQKDIGFGKQINYTLIAEKCLSIDNGPFVEEDNYQRYAEELVEPTRQLAVFIAKTGFNDVTWRNIPVMDINGEKSIALVDLEHMQSARNGFLGDRNGSCGLIGCVSKDQVDPIIKEARKHKIHLSKRSAKAAKDKRLQYLENEKKLEQFYSEKGIVHGNEPIDLDLDTLGIDLSGSFMLKTDALDIRTWNTTTNRDAAQIFINCIKDHLEKDLQFSKLKYKRKFSLPTSIPIFLLNPDFLSLTLKIGKAMVEKGRLFSFELIDGEIYIQA